MDEALNIDNLNNLNMNDWQSTSCVIFTCTFATPTIYLLSIFSHNFTTSKAYYVLYYTFLFHLFLFSRFLLAYLAKLGMPVFEFYTAHVRGVHLLVSSTIHWGQLQWECNGKP